MPDVIPFPGAEKTSSFFPSKVAKNKPLSAPTLATLSGIYYGGEIKIHTGQSTTEIFPAKAVDGARANSAREKVAKTGARNRLFIFRFCACVGVRCQYNDIMTLVSEIVASRKPPRKKRGSREVVVATDLDSSSVNNAGDVVGRIEDADSVGTTDVLAADQPVQGGPGDALIADSGEERSTSSDPGRDGLPADGSSPKRQALPELRQAGPKKIPKSAAPSAASSFIRRRG